MTTASSSFLSPFLSACLRIFACARIHSTVGWHVGDLYEQRTHTQNTCCVASCHFILFVVDSLVAVRRLFKRNECQNLGENEWLFVEENTQILRADCCDTHIHAKENRRECHKKYNENKMNGMEHMYKILFVFSVVDGRR